MVGTTRLMLAALALAVVGIAAAQAPGSSALGGRAGAPPGTPDTLSASGVVTTSGLVVALAADGSRVAIAVGSTSRWCSHIAVWDVARRTLVPMLYAGCPSEYGRYFDEVAIAGNRVAWISSFQPGNYVTYEVGIATIAPLRVHWLTDNNESGECNPFCTTGPIGSLVTNLVGQGDMLVLNSLSTCDLDPLGDPTCPDALRRLSGKDEGVAVETGALRLVTLSGLRHLASGLTTLNAVSVDAGRILVLRNPSRWGADFQPGADGSLAVYGSDGRVVETLGTAPAGILDARLQGRDVAVLTRNTVAVLDVETGRTLRAWPLRAAKNVHLEDIANGIVVYVAGRTIHLLRLRDGREATITPGPGSEVRAQLEPPGLFYSYGRHVAFVSRADLARRFAG